MRDFVDDIEKVGVQGLKDAGMQVNEVDRKPFADIVQKVYPEYHKKFTKELIESIQNTK